MTLTQFKELLLTVTDKVFHFEAQGDTDQEHIIWQEEQNRALHGDGRRTELIWHVQVDLYTKAEYPELLDILLNVLEEADVAFEEPIPDYDTETKFFRYIIECEVV